jgi:signal transduction histidine kinase
MQASGAQGNRTERRTAYRVVRLVIALGFGFLLAGTLDVGRLAVGSIPGGAIVLTLAGLGAATGIGYAAALTRSPARRAQRRDAEAAALAHDLRSPLLAARAYLELLEEGAFGPLSPDGGEAAGRAAHATSRAQAMLDGWLLRFAQERAGAAATGPTRERADAARRGGLPGEPRADVQALAHDAIESMALEMTRVHAQVEIGQLPRVRADGEAVYRVLMNLVQNALRHREPERELQLAITAEARGELWEIAVSDNGPGIAPELRERLFEPGARGPSTDGSEGFGLGLATVRRLVQQNGGRVWIDSTTTEGTCVRLTLPALAPR